ncbi:FKBP-type peptidyl-prolyl cis-trans isomerase [Fuerstiella marisgermanici]|uniref:Peptidyl-prolyl cis-trans isomerase n=1 Tax=Fuerstiella marisgermanici TaxID=1891926 RepID=A0A1P8WEG3_9PLAN|nr:FKBP-type peptidyl-prolyl cis-trans isomerase [Fuerstiella marisgermanici]APZ92463.1 Peptidyl-prolyl cis-trans isomerase Mip precursor [Fuerstiella marisgermanici]
MRLLLTAFSVLLIALPLQAQDKPEAASELKTNKDKVSYAIGLNIGRQFKSQGMDLDPAIVAQGIAAILNDVEPALTQQEMQAAFQVMQQEQEKLQREAATNNQAAAKKFLAENAEKKGVKQTKSGLQYMVLKEGTGKTPTAESEVSTHYRGKLISGKVFDESYEGKEPTAEDEPTSFPVNRVIPGWTEALQLMKVGAKYRLFVPPALAYGENGPPSIGPNSLLIFDIELVDVK